MFVRQSRAYNEASNPLGRWKSTHFIADISIEFPLIFAAIHIPQIENSQRRLLARDSPATDFRVKRDLQPSPLPSLPLSCPPPWRRLPQPVTRAHLPVKLHGVLLPQRPEVGLGYLLPAADYFQYLLRHPSPQGVDRVRMAEPVRTQANDSRPLRQALQNLAYSVGQQCIALLGHPQQAGAGRVGTLFPGDSPRSLISPCRRWASCALSVPCPSPAACLLSGPRHRAPTWRSRPAAPACPGRRTARRGREPTNRKRWAGVSARLGSARVRRSLICPSVTVGTVLSSTLGGSMWLKGFSSAYRPFHEPVEEPVQAAVLGVYVALGQLPGFDIGPLAEPPDAALEVAK